MMKINIWKTTWWAVFLAGLLAGTTGCTSDVDIPSFDESSRGVNHQVLLAVNHYTDNSIESEITYEYNEKGQIIRESNRFLSDGESLEEVYDLSYDDEGRLIKKVRSSGDSGYSSDDLERKYDESGNMIFESSFKNGDYWSEITYTYDSENRVAQEVWKVEYDENGLNYDTMEYKHIYSKRSDGKIEDKINWIEDGDIYGNNINVLDSSERLITGYDGYWDVPIQYEYIEDKYFNIYTESETVEDGGSAKSYTTYAEILDTAGKSVDEIYLSDKPEFDYDSQGYLIKAQNDNGYIEFLYGNIDDSRRVIDADADVPPAAKDQDFVQVPALGDVPVYIGKTVNEVREVLGTEDRIYDLYGTAALQYDDAGIVVGIEDVASDQVTGKEFITYQEEWNSHDLGKNYKTKMTMDEIRDRIAQDQGINPVIEEDLEWSGYYTETPALLKNYKITYYWTSDQKGESSSHVEIT